MIMRSRFQFCGPDGSLCLDEAKVVWQDIQAAAEEAYDRTAECSFTSFVGYEWTASVGNGENLHRNVIFRNARVPAYAPSWVETPSAFDLWQSLQRDCVDGVPGCDASRDSLSVMGHRPIAFGIGFGLWTCRYKLL